MKWQFIVESNDEDYYKLYFSGKIPRKIVSAMFKTLIGVSTSAAAIAAIVQQYFR